MSSVELPELMTIAEAAEYLAVSHVTVRRMIQRGDLPASQLGNSRIIRIKASDLKNAWRTIEPQKETI